jgi:drug/metabolite transporter (DMT)-like permease
MELSATQKRTLAIAGTMIASVIWGASFAIMKIALDSLSPLWFVVSRFAPAALILAAICGKKLATIDKNLLRDGLTVGAVLAFAYTLLMIGLQQTAASNGAFISGTYVVFVPFLMWLFTKKIRAANFILAFVTLIGVALLSLSAEFAIAYGDIWILASAMLFGVHLTLLGRFSPNYDPFLLSLLQLVTVAIVNTVLALIFEPLPQLANFSPQLIYAILYCAIFPTIIAYLLQTAAQKIISPVAISVLLMAQVIFGAFFSWLLLDELFSPRQFLGAAVLIVCMVVSVLLENLPQKPTLVTEAVAENSQQQPIK